MHQCTYPTRIRAALLVARTHHVLQHPAVVVAGVAHPGVDKRHRGLLQLLSTTRH